MNTRQIDILLNLIHKKTNRLDALSNEYDVSIRTIRQDLQDLNNYFSSYVNISTMDEDIKIEMKTDSKVLIDLILNDSYQFFVPTIDERRDMEAFILLINPNVQFANELSEMVGVSTGTISRDIIYVQKLLANEHITLEVKRNAGFKIIDPNDLASSVCFKILHKLSYESMIPYSFLINMLGEVIDRKRIQNILRDQEYRHALNLTDSSFSSILDYLLILSFHRKYTQSRWKEKRRKIGNFDDIFLKLSHDVLNEVEQFYNIHFSEKDQMELAFRIQNSGFLEPSKINSNFEIQMLVSSFIYDVFNDLEVREFLTYDSYTLLLQHITTMVERIRQDVLLKNPYLDEIKSIYKDQFMVVENRIEMLEDQLGLHLDDNEIAFIVIHILAIMEKDQIVKSLVRIQVVGVDSRSMFELMKNRIEQLLGVKVITPMSYHRYSQIKHHPNFLDTVDIIVSPLSLENSFKPVTKVSNFINSDDLSTLNREILSIRQKRQSKTKDEVLNKIIHYSDVVREILEKPLSKEELNGLLENNYKEIISDHGNEEDSILSLIDDQSILIDEEAKDWEEAILKVSQPLVNSGYIEKSYVEAMIKNVKINGPYMMFVPHVAVTHASPEDGVNKACISVLKLQNSVSFGHAEHDPCKIIFCLAVTDAKKDLKYFYKLMQVISNDAIVQLLTQTSSAIEFKEILKICEIEVGEVF